MHNCDRRDDSMISTGLSPLLAGGLVCPKYVITVCLMPALWPALGAVGYSPDPHSQMIRWLHLVAVQSYSIMYVISAANMTLIN